MTDQEFAALREGDVVELLDVHLFSTGRNYPILRRRSRTILIQLEGRKKPCEIGNPLRVRRVGWHGSK